MKQAAVSNMKKHRAELKILLFFGIPSPAFNKTKTPRRQQHRVFFQKQVLKLISCLAIFLRGRKSL
jgi:hypothetical protein